MLTLIDRCHCARLAAVDSVLMKWLFAHVSLVEIYVVTSESVD